MRTASASQIVAHVETTRRNMRPRKPEFSQIPLLNDNLHYVKQKVGKRKKGLLPPFSNIVIWVHSSVFNFLLTSNIFSSIPTRA